MCFRSAATVTRAGAIFIVKTAGHSFALGMHRGKVASECPSLFLTKAFDLGIFWLSEQPLHAGIFLYGSN